MLVMATVVRLLLLLLLLSTMVMMSLCDCNFPDPSYQCCNESPGFYQTCTTTKMTESDIINDYCTYTKNNTFNMSYDISFDEFPGLAQNLKADFVYLPNGHVMLNITWNLLLDGSLKYLQGFLLNVTFLHNTDPINILRTFNLTLRTSDLTSYILSKEELKTVTFYYDCLIPFPNTEYHIKLHSYPSLNFVMTYLVTAGNVNECSTTVTYRYSADWVACMWGSSFEKEAVIGVCFYAAPAEFGFNVYQLMLQTINDSLNLITNRITAMINITVDSQVVASNKICRNFTNVEPDVYRVLLEPVNQHYGIDDCLCKKADTNCVGSCMATELKSFVMTVPLPPTTQPLPLLQQSPTVSPDTTSPTTITTPPSTVSDFVFPSSSTVPPKQTQPTTNDDTNGKIAGIISGVVLSVTLIVVALLILLLIRACPPPDKTPDKKVPPSIPPLDPPHPGKEVIPAEGRKHVLLYFNDNLSHQNVTFTFVELLKELLNNCEVYYWPPFNVDTTLNSTWIHTQISEAKNVVVVHSEGYCRHVKQTPPGEVLAESISWSNDGSKRLFHVRFPYTEKEHCENMKEKTYILLDDFQNLLKDSSLICSPDERGELDTNQFKQSSNYSNLENAIKDARETNNNVNNYVSVSLPDSAYNSFGSDPKYSANSEVFGFPRHVGFVFEDEISISDMDFIAPESSSDQISNADTKSLESYIHQFNRDNIEQILIVCDVNSLTSQVNNDLNGDESVI